MVIPDRHGLPLDYRHSFVQMVTGDRLVEKDLRAEAETPDDGQVLEAAYLANRGVLDRLLGLFSGKSPRPALSLTPPFDAAGNDALGVWTDLAAIPHVEQKGIQEGAIRRVVGKIVPLSPERPQDGAVFRSFWLNDPPAVHASEAVDFVVVPEEGQGPRVVLSFGQAPLLIGKPSSLSVAGFLSRVGPRMRALLRTMIVKRPQKEQGLSVELFGSDLVEVVFVLKGEIRNTQSFAVGRQMLALPTELLAGEGGPYRGTTTETPFLLGGDAPGTRAVLRRR